MSALKRGLMATIVVIIGSRIPRTVCSTAVERLIAEETGRKFIERAQRGGF
ncbi:MAG: hypothetical protein ACR2PZ_25640 [Pseudomonadales bacterium]